MNFKNCNYKVHIQFQKYLKKGKKANKWVQYYLLTKMVYKREKMNNKKSTSNIADLPAIRLKTNELFSRFET